MKAFPYHSIDSAPEASKAKLQQAQDQYGFVPNMYAHLALSPVVLEAYQQLMSQFDNTTLSPVERQVVMLTVSVANCCRFCVPAHSVIAKHAEGVPAEVVSAIREQRPIEEDSRLEVLRRVTLQLVRARGYLSEEMLADFLAEGFVPEQALELVLGISLKVMSNYANHLMGTESQLEFSDEAWEPPEDNDFAMFRE